MTAYESVPLAASGTTTVLNPVGAGPETTTTVASVDDDDDDEDVDGGFAVLVSVTNVLGGVAAAAAAAAAVDWEASEACSARDCWKAYSRRTQASSGQPKGSGGVDGAAVVDGGSADGGEASDCGSAVGNDGSEGGSADAGDGVDGGSAAGIDGLDGASAAGNNGLDGSSGDGNDGLDGPKARRHHELDDPPGRGHHGFDDPPAGDHGYDDPPACGPIGLDVWIGMFAGCPAVGRAEGSFRDGSSPLRASDSVKLTQSRSGQSYGNDVGVAGLKATFDGAGVGNSLPRASDNEKLTQSRSGQSYGNDADGAGVEDKKDGRDGGRLIVGETAGRLTDGRVLGSPVGVGRSSVGTEPVVGSPFGSSVERPGGRFRGSELGRPGLRPLGNPG